jgi:hypothetical protein
LTATVLSAAEPPNEAKSAVSNPLSEIWANFMPGTRDIYSLEPEFYGRAGTASSDDEGIPDRKSLLDQIAGAIQDAKGDKPHPAFAVSSTGRKALQSATETIASGREPQQTFRPDEEITIVFFSRPAGSRVQLQKVVRDANAIDVFYRFYADGLTAMTSHVALIPLGRLPAGKYHVKFVQLPMGAREQGVGGELMEDWERQLICRAFSFTVEEPVLK